ncbi:hypothetical protein T12_6286 [Trichinella patagoniensis]|uniref:Uncharacterized protein n=1 Tax=Trichinella patagoniensis TaxID=990121 RepID=A0A0V0YXD7_9BILA|nr:hypothetical protein T12_6286 [Trichinella patagoniensis]
MRCVNKAPNFALPYGNNSMQTVNYEVEMKPKRRLIYKDGRM